VGVFMVMGGGVEMSKRERERELESASEQQSVLACVRERANVSESETQKV